MSNYLRTAIGPVPQTEAMPGQVANSAGGYSFGVDDWSRLDRFLILGSEGGSYYASERKLTKENAQAVLRCIAADGPEVVKRLVAVSDAGRAPKNDPAIFVLALCMKADDARTRVAAREAAPKVCRIGTHILHLAAFVNDLGGWGRGTKRAFAQWYNGKPASELGYQLVKYQSRDGWANRDVLRLAHPKAPTVDHAALYAWATGKADVDLTTLPPIVQGFEDAKAAVTEDLVIRLIREHNLPREALPTQWLKVPAVWDAMLPKMGLTALIRNLATMTRIGLISTGSAAASLVASRITDGEALRKSRVHPLAVLQALRTYQSGRSEKGTSTWKPVTRVVDALDAAFYASFGNVERTGKRYLLAIDVSGSMSSPFAGSSISSCEAATAMAMVTAAVEPECTIVGFVGASSARSIYGWGGQGWGGRGSQLVELNVSPRRRLDDNMKETQKSNFGTTDCAAPFTWALQNKREFDAFCVYTDSETYDGTPHAHVALKTYRKAVPGARSAVIATCSNGFTIADPNDPGMLDVVGFDTATPNVLASFFGG